MPELPEVESVVRTLRDGVPSLIGLQVESCTAVWGGVISSDSDRFMQQLPGCRFVTVGRKGKYILFGLETAAGSSCTLIVHLRMTGRLFLITENEPVGRHSRLLLKLSGGCMLCFDDPRKFGRVWLTDDPAEVTGALGPDALTVSRDVFIQRLAGHRRQIKPLLLDQSFLAGIGNIYADESLFRAGIHPCAVSDGLPTESAESLHREIISVLHEAVEANGANIDGVFKAGQFQVRVYGRQGLPCIRCGSVIQKIRVGQRGSHLCPECQPAK